MIKKTTCKKSSSQAVKTYTLLFTLFLCFVANIQIQAQTWNWQNPLPQGNNLYSVFFTSNDTGYTVGLNGVILKTTDAGISWLPQNSGTTNSLLTVFFVSNDTGYVGGSSSTLLRTYNGGATWTTLTGPSPIINSLYFTSAMVGYAAGSSGNAGVIIKTINGGASWTVQGSGGVTLYNSIHFYNDSIGYVAAGGGKIYKTINAGANWTLQTSGVTTSLFSVFAATANRAYVSDYGRMFRSSNGGSNWAYANLFQAYELYSTYFTDSLTGYAVGRTGKIVKTINGGVNWTYLNSGTSINLRSVFFTDANNGYTVGESGIILKTTDAGATWTSFTNLAYFFQLNDASFPSQCVGYAVGNQGKILKTSNSGGSWTLLSSGINKNLQSVFFTDDTTGYAVADSGKIVKTLNGGNSWILQSSGLTTSLASVFFTNTDTGYAAGVNGKILKTVDGGSTWLLLTSGVTESLTGIYFIDRNTGFAVGGSGRLVKTIDAGATWTIKYTATTLDLKSVFFSSPTTGYITGVSGHIRKTTNGGNSWTQLANNINYVITSIAFIDDNNGYAVGYDYNDYGKIYTTTNGGINWSVETISWDHMLRSVSVVDSNTVYIVGNNGAILKSGGGSTLITTTNYSVCEGSPLNLVASGTSGSSFVWSGPNGYVSSQQNPLVSSTATPALNGSYLVTAAINGCANTQAITNVMVYPTPAAPIASNNGPVDMDSTLTLFASSIVGATYAWTGPNGFTSNLQNPTVSDTATLAMNGTYDVIVTVNGCSSAVASTSAVVNTTVGISDNESNEILKVFPNPASERLVIEINKLDETQSLNRMVYVYNNMGECVMQQAITKGINYIDVHAFTSGMYTIKYDDATSTTHHIKWVKP